MRSRSFQIDSLEPRLLCAVTPVIQVLNGQSTINAGQAVFVNALQDDSGNGTTLGTGSPITAQYKWDFGDTTAGARYDTLPGWNAGHVYDTPGTYTITLTITDDTGEVGVAQQTVQVNSPSITPTIIYVDTTATGVTIGPGGGTVTAPSIASALPYLSNNTQLLFDRGETFVVPQTINVPFSNVTIGTFGDPSLTAPVLQVPSGWSQLMPIISMTNASNGIVINGLQFNSAGSKTGEAIRPDGTNIVIRNCDFEQMDDAIMNDQSPVGLIAMDNNAGVLKEYFAYINGSDQVYLGNTVADSTSQHNIRTYGFRVLVYGNDFTNLTSGNSSIDTLRINDGGWVYWANNTLRAGPVLIEPLGPTDPGTNPGAEVNWVVFENNKWLQVAGQWSNHNRIEVDAGVQHVMIRNNYIEATDATCIYVDTSETLTWQPSQLPAVPIALPPITVKRISTDIDVLNNTVVDPDLGDGTHQGKKGCFIEVAGTTASAVILKNNLYVAPKLDTTANTAAAVRVSGRNDLNNFVDGGIANNDWPSPANLNTLGVNYVSDGSLTAAQAYRTPAEWASNFPGKISGDIFENLNTTDLDATLAPPTTSLAATNAITVAGVFTDLYGNARPSGPWTDGAVQLIASTPSSASGSSTAQTAKPVKHVVRVPVKVVKKVLNLLVKISKK